MIDGYDIHRFYRTNQQTARTKLRNHISYLDRLAVCVCVCWCGMCEYIASEVRGIFNKLNQITVPISPITFFVPLFQSRTQPSMKCEKRDATARKIEQREHNNIICFPWNIEYHFQNEHFFTLPNITDFPLFAFPKVFFFFCFCCSPLNMTNYTRLISEREIEKHGERMLLNVQIRP